VSIRNIKAKRSMVALVIAALCAVGAGGCGGDPGIPGNAVAQVGNEAIGKATVDHWMSAFLRGDYYEKVGAIMPRGLFPEPPDYATCVSTLTAITTPPSGSRGPAVGQLKTKCAQLYEGIKLQTIGFLLTYQWSLGQGAEHGLKLSRAELEQEFKRVQAEHFPTETELQHYLIDHGLTIADELILVTRNVETAKLLHKLNEQGGEKALITYYKRSIPKWTMKTSCRPGYVVEQCKEYKTNRTPTGPSPSVLLEEIAALEQRAHPPKKNPLEREDQLCRDAPAGGGYECVPNPRGSK
jgi:hypothetical protein